MIIDTVLKSKASQIKNARLYIDCYYKLWSVGSLSIHPFYHILGVKLVVGVYAF